MKKTKPENHLQWNRTDHVNWMAVRDADTTYHVTRERAPEQTARFIPYMIYVNRADYSDRNITYLSDKPCKTLEAAWVICEEHCRNHYRPTAKNFSPHLATRRGDECYMRT